MGTKSGNIAILYSSIAVLSLLLLIGYLLWEKKKEKHLTCLFACVAIANCGYFLQSVVDTLEGALWANRISYLGGAYLSLLMLLIRHGYLPDPAKEVDDKYPSVYQYSSFSTGCQRRME